MAGFATWALLNTALQSDTRAFTPPHIAVGAGGFQPWKSNWRIQNFANPAATPGDVYTSHASSMNLPDRSPVRKFLTKIGAFISGTTSRDGVIMIYDRLVGVGGIATTVPGNVTVATQALTRYTDGFGVMAMAEVTTAMTVTNSVLSINSYTNETGATGRVGEASITLNTTATQSAFFMLQAGDLGVRAISTVNIGTASTLGAINVVLIKPLACLSFSQNAPPAYFDVDLFGEISAFARIYDGATLDFLVSAQGATTATHGIYLDTVAG